AAERTLKTQENGLIVLHWPDADKAGHANGWMSPQYARAARNADNALGDLAARIDADDASSLLIVVADHGGGGVRANEHDSMHPLDYTIPIVFAGGGVVQRHLGANVDLLDVPATILWSLGIAQPESYAGRPIRNAFRATEDAAPLEVANKERVAVAV
ncbi:MAG: alkaline phosphatase family protein, partial [Gemmatimonadaceae bacterium]